LQDISSLGSVNLRYAGYIVTVKVEAKEGASVDSLSPMIETFDHPDGGANALNPNRLVSLTHYNAGFSCCLDILHVDLVYAPSLFSVLSVGWVCTD